MEGLLKMAVDVKNQGQLKKIRKSNINVILLI